MSLDPKHFRQYIVRPALKQFDMWSPAAENLVCGTAYKESKLKWLKQLGAGPALGLFQMEPATHDDIWDNYLNYRSGLANMFYEILADKPNYQMQLQTNLFYAAAMCRIHYYRKPEPLPDADDIMALGHYWKEHYNTAGGKGTAAEFHLDYKEFEKL